MVCLQPSSTLDMLEEWRRQSAHQEQERQDLGFIILGLAYLVTGRCNSCHQSVLE